MRRPGGRDEDKPMMDSGEARKGGDGCEPRKKKEGGGKAHEMHTTRRVKREGKTRRRVEPVTAEKKNTLHPH